MVIIIAKSDLYSNQVPRSGTFLLITMDAILNNNQNINFAYIASYDINNITTNIALSGYNDIFKLSSFYTTPGCIYSLHNCNVTWKSNDQYYMYYNIITYAITTITPAVISPSNVRAVESLNQQTQFGNYKNGSIFFKDINIISDSMANTVTLYIILSSRGTSNGHPILTFTFNGSVDEYPIA